MKVRDVDICRIDGYGLSFIREDYDTKVEIPGIEACKKLYDLNIQTFGFNCHKDFPDVSLQFVYDTLSDENKFIAEGLKKDGYLDISRDLYGGKIVCTISFPAKLDDDVDKISERLCRIVENFKYQDIMFSYKPFQEYINNQRNHGIEISKDDLIDWGFDPETGEFFDGEEELVWDKEEYYQKHKQYLQSFGSKGTGSR